MPKKDPNAGQISAQAQQDLVSDGIENFELPKSVVQRIARAAVPDNTKLAKETVYALLKGSTVFISYLAATSHDVAVSKQHKSISASDVIKAMELIGFGDLSEFLQTELNAYRELMKEKGTKKTAGTTTSGHKKTASTSGAPPSAAKGKGKEKAALPPAMTRTPVASKAATAAPVPAPPPLENDQMEVDEEGPLRLDPKHLSGKPDVEEEKEALQEDEAVDEEEVDEEEVDEEEEDEVEEDEDQMMDDEAEAAELKKDAKGLEAFGGPQEDDDS